MFPHSSKSTGSLDRLIFKSNNPVWILAHSSMHELAQAIVACCETWQSKILKGVESTRTIEYKQILQWDRFNDGFPKLFIRNVREMAGKDVLFLMSLHDVSVLFEQIAMVMSLPGYLAHSVTVILPYFPTGTMERIDQEGQIATAKTLATMLSSIPITVRGAPQIIIFDIHALQERFYFGNKVLLRLETAIPLLLKELQVKSIEDGMEFSKIAIAFPDEGASKRFDHHFSAEFTRIICSKNRYGDQRNIKLREGNPRGLHVVIVDDLVQTGGTLIECAKVLKAAGAADISGYVTHAVFPQESWKKFIDQPNSKSVFKYFWITDSLPHARQIVQHPPFRLLTLAPIISESLLGFDLKLMA